MKQKYQIDGIGCGGCVTKVKEPLEKHPAIENTEIFLNPIGATFITMNKTLTVAELQKQLNILKWYTITEIN
jgi:copper chaperone CopZ